MIQPKKLGATLSTGGIHFAVWSGAAERMWVSIFDPDGSRESVRQEMTRGEDGRFETIMSGAGAGTRYGFRADGPYDPENGFWFDPEKLLVDPYAVEIDRRYVQDARLTARRGDGDDTAPLVPKAVVRAPMSANFTPPTFLPGGLIYEVPVRAFTMLHPHIPAEQRGTIAALAHPAIIAHLKKLGVSAVELMPVTACIDERHLGPLGLSNSWGYNPVTFMALDPRLAPGGIDELRDTAAALAEAGIGVILDLVFNHTGESDVFGPTLSLRGLGNRAYYRHQPGQPARLVNDTGCGNTVDCAHPVVAELVLETLRHFVIHAGIAGFRFDLAPILGRVDGSFDPNAPLLTAIANDPVLAGRTMIAEPWDIGDGGYQLGNFPPPFLEWNDHYRDDVRRFWRGDVGMIGKLATRLAGSSDIFARSGQGATRSVNFLAAHDGFSLADVTRYERKHNEANGEKNRDGHNENLSWNNGVEGKSDDPKVVETRRRDLFALLSTLYASRGTIMLTAGDEFGRTQNGNNNAYAQDNETTWLDWRDRDLSLEAHAAALGALRCEFAALGAPRFLTGAVPPGEMFGDVAWLSETGAPLDDEMWHTPDRHRLTMVLAGNGSDGGRLAVVVNGDRRAVTFALPTRPDFAWIPAAGTERDIQRALDDGGFVIERRSVVFLLEMPFAL